MLNLINTFLNSNQVLIATVLLPSLFFVVNYLIKAQLNRMPAARRMFLEQIVSTAVNAVEQVTGLGSYTGQEKQQLALKFIEAELSHYGLDVPESVLIPLIEEAVFLLNVAQGKSTAAAHALHKIG